MRDGVAPARRILEAAQQANDRLGHENLGSLSYSHGFLPRVEPRRSLPPAYAAWDQIAAGIPQLYRDYAVRRGVAELPVLNADALPDDALTRAAALFGILAHVYWYAEPEPPEGGIPPQIQMPWEQISARLDRPAPHLSFMDVNSHNWHFIDPHADDPFRMENLLMAIPMVGNEDERRFQMTPVEMLFRFASLMEPMLMAQEAVLHDEPQRLADALSVICDGLRDQTYVSLQKVNPNPYSDTYINPVVWGKTAALFASPFQTSDAPPGPSGTAIPSFTTLDIFFGRKSYRTTVGHETDRTRGWFPLHWREWLLALEQVSVGDYVSARGNAELSGIYAETRDAYAGESGLLSRHRLKAYGFLDLSFKGGRVKTLGGFSGSYSERVWDRMATELDEARLERYGGTLPNTHFLQVRRVETLREHDERAVRRVVFDIGGRGIRYQAGDRCGILPENSDELVERTLHALKATGHEVIALDAAWRRHMALRHGFDAVTSLPLRVMLKFGRIRPVDRPVVIRLHAITGSERLRSVIDHWAEDQWELWDMLELMAGEGYNPKRLWRAIPGDREHLCQIVRPEQWRLYSISSAWAESQDELHLTVGGLRYWTQDTGVSRTEGRQGTGSNFLGHLAAGGSPLAGAVSIKIVHPPRFSLPRDPDRPIVMIAAGTGIAPMRGLIDERIRCGSTGPNWLFYGAQEWDDFYYRHELAPLAVAGNLTVRAAFSREDVSVQFDAERGQFVRAQGKSGRVDSLLLAPENSQQLWHMLQGISDGGSGAYFYVCGRTPFANSVLEALKAVIMRYVSPANGETHEAAAGRVLYRLIGEDRLMLEIFTTYAGAHFEHAKPQFDLSDVARHNDDANGYWIVISGRVYDMNKFNHIHPGGAKIIQSYSGMDGTLAYQKVEHHLNPEVDAMLGMVELGMLRTPDFGAEWGIAVSGSGLRLVTLRDAYSAWIDLLHMLVEIENAVQNDFRVRDEPLTDIEVDGPLRLTAAKVNQLALAHERLVTGYLAHLLGGPVETLWAMIVGVTKQGNLDARWMRKRLTEAVASNEARAVTEFAARLRVSLKEEDSPESVDARCAALCDTLEAEDRAMLRALKQALCSGAKLLETHERDSVRLAGEQLIEILQSIPALLEHYYRQFNARTS